jgi:hypothetical protein
VGLTVLKCLPHGAGGASEGTLFVDFMALLPDGISEVIPKSLVCQEYVEREILDGKIAGK